MNDPDTLEPLHARSSRRRKNDATRLDLVRAYRGCTRTPTAPAVPHRPSSRRRTSGGDGAGSRLTGLEKFPTAADVLAQEATGQPDKTSAKERARAFEALGVLKAKSGRKACETGVKDESPEVRRAAVATLGKLGDADANGSAVATTRRRRRGGSRQPRSRRSGALEGGAAIPRLPGWRQRRHTVRRGDGTGTDAGQARFISGTLTGHLRVEESGFAQGVGGGHRHGFRQKRCTRSRTTRQTQRSYARELLPELRAVYLAYVPDSRAGS